MEKKNPTELSLPSPFLPSLSRDVGFYSNSRYKIVALKMHETTLSHPEWWIDFVPSPPTLQQKHDKISILCTWHPWPLRPFSHHHPGQSLIHESLASKRYWGDHTSVRVGTVPSVGSSSCRPPRGSPRLVELHLLSGQCACSRDHMSYSQELIVQELKCWTWKTDHLLKSCFYPVAFPFLVMLREESDLKKKQTGCAQRKRQEFYFSLPASRRKFFLQFAWGIF